MLAVALAACGSPDPVVDATGALRAQVRKAIDRDRSIDDAEAALALLEAKVPGGDRELYEQLAELYRARWESAKPHTVRVLESFAKDAQTCLRVSQDITSPDPAALRTSLVKELTRGRELYRKACNFRYAYEASAWLGDVAGYEADIAAMHRPPVCTRFVVQPTAEHDSVGIELAFADERGQSDVATAVEHALALDASSPTLRCRANVARAYGAERAGDLARARTLYADVPGKQAEVDDCYATAEARRLALSAPAPTMTHVTAHLEVPPDTTVRVAFQAIPPVVPGGESPSIFGNGSSIRYPWPRRDQYFYVDATITHDRLDVTLPGGHWLPQIELDPAGKWTLAQLTPCLTEIVATGGEVVLPDLTFVPVQ
ncbi:MAG: hypothetical protein NT062_01625 [Proteobacteria bacterium]|nr:hypothetical protein [Pseudomonadota bacterium]